MGKIREIPGKIKTAKGRVIKAVKPGFWKEVLKALHPKSYSELSTRSIRKGIGYLLSVLLASFIIMAIISLPKITLLPDQIEGELEKFEVFNISIDTEMSSPIKFTESDPQIVIDTTGNTTVMGDEKLLITEDYIYYRPYARAKAYNISEFKDITEKKKEISRMLTFLAIILIPTILITSYILFLVKYIITIIAASLLLFVAARIAKENLGILKSLNTALYAATPMILLEVIFIPFNSRHLIPLFQLMGMNFYMISLLIYIALAVVGAYFAMKRKKGKKGEDYKTVEKVQWDF